MGIYLFTRKNSTTDSTKSEEEIPTIPHQLTIQNSPTTSVTNNQQIPIHNSPTTSVTNNHISEAIQLITNNLTEYKNQTPTTKDLILFLDTLINKIKRSSILEYKLVNSFSLYLIKTKTIYDGILGLQEKERPIKSIFFDKGQRQEIILGTDHNGKANPITLIETSTDEQQAKYIIKIIEEIQKELLSI